MASSHVIWSQNTWFQFPTLPNTDMGVLTFLKLGFFICHRGLIIHSLYNSELFFKTLNFLIVVPTIFSYILCHFAR